ncbi:MAG: MOSC domain-containing protein [Planctomycetaceae bacterium]|jgi:hypothetical protein|nr:MOSC domain-containing protein [Planctomycetaceae bacterium]MBT6156681.1 MOSC domain-containing protein [Planctomycetaceae bacterium]MBT6486433.1 MOSC domain-containing protein [Planctomycetaceae bacterium]MBT6494000.1 MOSC domain-containing protein [Planctomycetaceae bacterium]
MSTVTHRSLVELEAGIDEIRRSPKDQGPLELIVCRSAENQRETLERGVLDIDDGLVGDNWKVRPSTISEDGLAHPDMQINLTNVRAISLIAVERERWQLAGDQLYVDLDLSGDNLPPGTRLAIGSAIIEVTDQPHRGCAKFNERFGNAALKFVNSPVGIELNLRGINARVVKSGEIHPGDTVTKTKL